MERAIGVDFAKIFNESGVHSCVPALQPCLRDWTAPCVAAAATQRCGGSRRASVGATLHASGPCVSSPVQRGMVLAAGEVALEAGCCNCSTPRACQGKMQRLTQAAAASRQNLKLIDKEAQPKGDAKAISFKSQYAQSQFQQVCTRLIPDMLSAAAHLFAIGCRVCAVGCVAAAADTACAAALGRGLLSASKLTRVYGVQFMQLLNRNYTQYWRNVPYNGGSPCCVCVCVCGPWLCSLLQQRQCRPACSFHHSCELPDLKEPLKLPVLLQAPASSLA